jgi:predicted RNA-binding protein with PUA-like domain
MPEISIDEAEDIIYADPVAIQDISEHRWYTKQLVVFKKHGALYGFNYLKPASELQEDQDRFESDRVKIFPVSSRKVTTTVYEVIS